MLRSTAEMSKLRVYVFILIFVKDYVNWANCKKNNNNTIKEFRKTL